MRKNSRAYKIAEAGFLAYEESKEGTNGHDLLLAIAAMIDFATAKKKPEKKEPLLYNELDVIRTLNYELAIVKHGPLNRQLRNLNLLETDLEQFGTWFRESMYPWMSKEGVVLTYSMLTRKYPEWLERARQWAANPNKTTVADHTAEWR